MAITRVRSPLSAKPRPIILIVFLILIRIVAGAVTPLAFDEAYYWRWSKHLAGGYFDHPPMVAVVIRLGTLIAVGWRQLAGEIDLIRQDVGARGVLTTNYGLTSWLSFYLPSRPPVVQVNERYHWENETALDVDLFKGPLIYVCWSSVPEACTIEERYKDVREIATVTRQRTGIVIDALQRVRVEGLVNEPLDKRTLHDVLEQQRLAPERPVQAQGQRPPPVAENPAQSCESEIDHAAAHNPDGNEPRRNNL